jgi:3-deoxy-D-manno-octulosonate 8-phosphate phosphatase (KDO 8-P phosphatase)
VDLPDALRARLARVRLLCLDVDGVLTDGHLYWSPAAAGGRGTFWQRFNVRDGVGIQRVMEHGIEVAILSGGDVASARDRAASLGIRHAHFGLRDKLMVFRELIGTLGVSSDEVAFIGDELADLPLLELVGFAASVPDAVEAVRRAAAYVTRRPGGDGAVREVCDLILAARGS